MDKRRGKNPGKERRCSKHINPYALENITNIWQQNESFIRNAILSQVNDADLAEDIFQDFFLSLISKPIDPNMQNIKGYLHRAIRNDIIDAARRRKSYRALLHRYATHRNHTSIPKSVEYIVANTEEAEKMLDHIQALLVHSEAEAIRLRHHCDYSVGEVADKLQVKKRTVSRYVSVGLKKLRQFLKTVEDKE